MDRTVAIARYPSLGELADGWVTVGIDVIRATTTAVTAVAAGRRCFPVASLEAAVPLAARLHRPLLVGELGGNMPYGFHLQNSPAEMARAVDLDRPVILLSSSGTGLLAAAAAHGPTYAACLRNVTATVERITAAHRRVLILAGESRGEFREEDRLCAARIAAGLVRAGFEPRSLLVEELIRTWGEASDESIMVSHSVDYLRDTGQMHDVEFIASHIDDLPHTYEMHDGELVATDAR